MQELYSMSPGSHRRTLNQDETHYKMKCTIDKRHTVSENGLCNLPQTSMSSAMDKGKQDLFLILPYNNKICNKLMRS